MPLVVLILALLMVLGGTVPNVANGMLHQQLDRLLNHPEKIEVTLYPEHPSFSLIGGALAYVQVDISRFKWNALPIESLQIHLDRTQIQLNQGKPVLKHPTRASVHIQLTEKGINQFLTSQQAWELIEKMKRSMPIDADIKNLQVDLQEDQVLVSGKAYTLGGFFTVPFSLAGRFRLQNETQLFLYEADTVRLDRALAPELLQSILDQINPILDLGQFNTPQLELFFRSVSIHSDQIDLIGEIFLHQGALLN